MRDAFGGTFMFKIIFIFIVMYVTLATIVVSYSKTFRLKNKVLDMLEQNQFFYNNSYEHDATFVNSNAVIQKVDAYLEEHTYHFNDKTMQKVISICEGQNSNAVTGGQSYKGRVTLNGACVLPIEYESGKFYYRVTLYMHATIPLIGYDVLIPVSGETKDFN